LTSDDIVMRSGEVKTKQLKGGAVEKPPEGNRETSRLALKLSAAEINCVHYFLPDLNLAMRFVWSRGVR
jgi:hypothetical protein